MIVLCEYALYDTANNCSLLTNDHRSSYHNLVDINEKERQRQDTSDIRYLRLLRAMIHNEIMFIDPDAREEGQDPALFRKYV